MTLAERILLIAGALALTAGVIHIVGWLAIWLWSGL